MYVLLDRIMKKIIQLEINFILVMVNNKKEMLEKSIGGGSR